MVASSLEEFLAVWALAGFDSAGDLVASGHRVSLPFDLLYQADSGAPDGRADFLDFLRQRLGREPQAIVGPHPPHQPIERFFEEWSETQRQKMATDSTLRSIAGILDAYIPRGKQPWDRVSLDIRVAGARCEIDAPEGPKTPLAEEREIIPLVLAARATGVHAVRGVWHSAAIRLTPDGLCRIAANWQREPVFRDGTPPTADEIAADLARIRAARAGWSRGCTRQDNSERRVTRRRRTASQHDCPVAAAFGGFRHRFASRTRATFRNRDSTSAQARALARISMPAYARSPARRPRWPAR